MFGYNAVKNKKIRITFNLNGGKSDEEVKNLEIKFGETFNYNPPTPTLEDSVFKGWYLSKDGYANDEKPYKLGVPVYENTIIYANWKEHKQHEYNEFCTCIECGKINHDCGTEGICIVCGLQVHENLESCYCDSCSKYYHSFDEESICTLCGSDGIVYSGNELHKYYGVASTLVIPDSVTSIGDYAFSNCSSLESVVIPDSVTSIGWDAFRDCSSLTSIVIPDSVTSIAGDAFEGCSSLESVVIPDSVTSIGGSAFRDCSSLTSVVIGDSVTSIGDWAFRDCSSLTSVVIGDSVTRIGSSAFYNCSSLTSVVIPDSVTSIGSYAFYACSSLTIYCEAENKPSGWDSRWIFDDRPVEWGYEG